MGLFDFIPTVNIISRDEVEPVNNEKNKEQSFDNTLEGLLNVPPPQKEKEGE